MFGAIVVLLREFPELFRDEKGAIRAEFEENVSDEIDAFLDNCDTYDDVGWVEDGLRELGQIAQELSIDISDELASGRSRLEALVSEVPGEEESDESPWDGVSGPGAGGSDEEIDELFGHLRDERD
jgi:hypothetical protein